MLKRISQVLMRAKHSSDVVLAVVMAAILGAMIVPLPAWAVDLGLALNLAAAAALLVAALYARDALKVASFPTLLLVTTLFRLALNVSSTRLALSEGHAGRVIEAFGEFVVRGEYVVGAVVFVILTLVQFLVVAKGAERVAEVSARFTLDAMPGKQMSIDADLRAGAIDQAQARGRRRELERESQLFGAMDGAMKFVKGDVIAGLVIVLVNFLGGVAIGVLQNGMSASEAASTYALIAIGDGLVSQLPSLCIAVAAALVVTRVAGEQADASLGSQMGSQFFGHSKPLWIVSALCLALALVPAMPAFPFLLLAGLGAAGGWALRRRERAGGAGKEGADPSAAAPETAGAPPAQAGVGVSPLTLDLSVELSSLVSEEGGRFVKKDLELLREQLYLELGVRIPGIRIRTGASYAGAGGYCFLLDEVPVAKGVLAAGGLYALVAPQELGFLEVPAEKAVEPSSGREISRVAAQARSRLELAQVAVRRPAELLCEHLASILRRRAASLLGVQEVQGMLDGLEASSPLLVKEAVAKVPVPLLTDVLRRLVQEEVSIRNLRAILEALVAPATEGDAAALAERCRQGLQGYLTHKYAPAGPLYAYLADPGVEEAVRASKSGGLSPERVASILEGFRRIATGGRTVVLAAPDVRRSLRKLCEGAYPGVAVLTYGDLNADLQIRPIGKLAAA